MADIAVDDDVKQMIIRERMDYRVCTVCTGAALVPTLIKPGKDSDIKISVGENTLFVSRIQAQEIDRISMNMLYDAEKMNKCFVFTGKVSIEDADRMVAEAERRG